MAKSETTDTLDLENDMDFQRASWKVQRAGWWIMVALVLAALAGVFGGGPLAKGKAGDLSSGLTLEYQRYTRLNAPQTIAFDIAPVAVGSDSVVRVWLDRGWIESHEITDVAPEPASSRLLADRIVYAFDAGRSPGPLRVRFRLETRAFGRMHGRAGIVDGPAVSFSQLAYP